MFWKFVTILYCYSLSFVFYKYKKFHVGLSIKKPTLEILYGQFNLNTCQYIILNVQSFERDFEINKIN